MDDFRHGKAWLDSFSDYTVLFNKTDKRTNWDIAPDWEMHGRWTVNTRQTRANFFSGFFPVDYYEDKEDFEVFGEEISTRYTRDFSAFAEEHDAYIERYGADSGEGWIDRDSDAVSIYPKTILDKAEQAIAEYNRQVALLGVRTEEAPDRFYIPEENRPKIIDLVTGIRDLRQALELQHKEAISSVEEVKDKIKNAFEEAGASFVLSEKVAVEEIAGGLPLLAQAVSSANTLSDQDFAHSDAVRTTIYTEQEQTNLRVCAVINLQNQPIKSLEMPLNRFIKEMKHRFSEISPDLQSTAYLHQVVVHRHATRNAKNKLLETPRSEYLVDNHDIGGLGSHDLLKTLNLSNEEFKKFVDQHALESTGRVESIQGKTDKVLYLLECKIFLSNKALEADQDVAEVVLAVQEKLRPPLAQVKVEKEKGIDFSAFNKNFWVGL